MANTCSQGQVRKKGTGGFLDLSSPGGYLALEMLLFLLVPKIDHRLATVTKSVCRWKSFTCRLMPLATAAWVEELTV